MFHVVPEGFGMMSLGTSNRCHPVRQGKLGLNTVQKCRTQLCAMKENDAEYNAQTRTKTKGDVGDSGGVVRGQKRALDLDIVLASQQYFWVSVFFPYLPSRQL